MIETLPESFSIATFFGIWTPIPWRTSLIGSIYKLYTYFNVMVIFLLTLAQLIALIVFTKSMSDFAEASYVFLAGLNGFIKGMNILLQQYKVTKLIETLADDDCRPRNPEEEAIRASWDRVARYTVLTYGSLVGLSSSSTAIWPVFGSEEKYTLQLPAWYPYNISNDLVYVITYVHQGWGIIVGAAWNTVCDTLVAGFLMQTCAQLDIVLHRLKFLPEESRAAMANFSGDARSVERMVLRNNVRHHLKIFKFAKSIQSIFTPSIFLQFCLSVFIVCITIFGLTSKSSNNSAPVSTMLIFLSSILWELFLYCWFGNEVTLKSVAFSKGITESNWTELHASTLKGLIILMKRTTTPIFLTCGPFITLNLSSFMSIIKLSYSVFNVLETAS